ncbi:MAG: VOC family protein [Pseudomonadota bacterium]
MMSDIVGLHHVTAISGDAQANHDFYVKVLGQRMVKKTVNFDAPDVYHLYYADGAGTPGTVMTFFPFPNARRGRVGRGQVVFTHYAVPQGSLDYWAERIAAHGGKAVAKHDAFGAARLIATDPEGLGLVFVEVAEDARAPWTGADVPAEYAVRGFEGVTLGVSGEEATAAILTGIFGYERVGEEVSDSAEGAMRRIVRFAQPGVAAGVVDLLIDPALPDGIEAAGTVHHVAFRVEDRAAQDRVRKAVAAQGHHVTPQIDRDYFYAIYFRTPEGILFEVATDEPGFDRDEPMETLGEALKLPSQHEHLRPRLEETLPKLVA